MNAYMTSSNSSTVTRFKVGVEKGVLSYPIEYIISPFGNKYKKLFELSFPGGYKNFIHPG